MTVTNLGQGRHGARSDSAHICVMPSGGHEEHYLVIDEDGRDDGDVWEMRATCQLGVIRHQHVTLCDVVSPIGHLVAH